MPAPRPKVRKTQGLHNLGRGGQPNTHYLTTCSACGEGIYKGQSYSWVRDPRRLGLWHDRCVEERA